GLFLDRGAGISLAQLTRADGASNTLAVGEALGGAPDGQRDFSFSWMGVGALVTWFGLPTEGTATDPPNPGKAGWWNFSSRHSGIVNFCFADGSVRGVRKGPIPPIPPATALSADYVNFVLVSGWNDGGIVDPNAL